MIIKLSKEVSGYIEANASASDDYYWFPYYFKKVGDGVFEILFFKDIVGDNLKHITEELLPRNEKE